MVVVRAKFLWLPKRINGKWYWLKKVYAHTESQLVTIGGQITFSQHTTYSVKE